MKKRDILLKLFFSTLYLSAFTFGGGYVIVTLMKKQFVDKYHWIEESEMLDLIAIAQSAPGAIAVNGSIVVGYKLAGVGGAALAVIATVLPPFAIITLLSFFYQLFRDNPYVAAMLSGMQAGVAAVIASVVWDMGAEVVRSKSASSVLIMLTAFLLASVFHVNVIYIVLGCILLGTARTLIFTQEETVMIYLQLFWSFFQIGAFSFGGGYAAMPLIQAQIVDLHGWLSMAEFTDLITISQMTPGPIAVNSATFVGTKIAGVPGALVSTIGCVLPSCVLVTLLARLYLRYRSLTILQDILGSLRPAVVAMIASSGVLILIQALWSQTVSLSGTNWLMLALFLAAFFLLRKTKLSPILIMLLAGAVNVAVTVLR